MPRKPHRASMIPPVHMDNEDIGNAILALLTAVMAAKGGAA